MISKEFGMTPLEYMDRVIESIRVETALCDAGITADEIQENEWLQGILQTPNISKL